MSMLSLLACAAMLQAPIQQPPRLRTILENGSVILVEPLREERAVVLSLWVSAASYPEAPIHNGVRHLMEHFLARGHRGDIDRRLESAGGFLKASTYRDAMNFEVTVPKDKVSLGLSVIQETMSLKAVTQEEIEREAEIIRREGDLRDAPMAASSAAWEAAYKGLAPDPFGNLDVIKATTPATLAEAHRLTFRGAGLALVVVGDVDLDLATKQAKEVLGVLPKGVEGSGLVRSESSEAVAGGASWRAAKVGGFREPSTAAALMAGLAIASELQEPFFTYTPSVGPAMMVVGGEGWGSLQSAGMFQTGRSLAQQWVRSQLNDARGIAFIRGILLCQGPALRPETLLENIEHVGPGEFERALAQFGVAN